MAGVPLVLHLPDGTKYHVNVPGAPRRGDVVYLTDVGVGRVEQVQWTFGPDALVQIVVQVVDWVELR